MSTRAVLIRRMGNVVEFGQTKWDGMDNQHILSTHWTDLAKVKELFAKLIYTRGEGYETRGLGVGISSLNDTMESTQWYDSSYNCDFIPLEDFNKLNLYNWARTGRLDFAEFLSCWNGQEWKTWDLYEEMKDEEKQQDLKDFLTLAPDDYTRKQIVSLAEELDFIFNDGEGNEIDIVENLNLYPLKAGQGVYEYLYENAFGCYERATLLIDYASKNGIKINEHELGEGMIDDTPWNPTELLKDFIVE